MNENNFLQVVFKEIVTDNDMFCQFDETHGVLFLDVKSAFTAEDFVAISSLIDPYFAEHGELRGVILNCKKFPRWSGHQNRLQYINFARENHHKFKKAAFAMGGLFVKIIVRLAKGKAHPEMKIFKHSMIFEAQKWVLGEDIRVQ